MFLAVSYWWERLSLYQHIMLCGLNGNLYGGFHIGCYSIGILLFVVSQGDFVKAVLTVVRLLCTVQSLACMVSLLGMPLTEQYIAIISLSCQCRPCP